jgi:cupin 2 domain-containing protein
MNAKPIQPGRYRHFKGNEYTVVGTARHSETLEEQVVYRQEYGDYGLWTRPKQMFLEMVQVNGEEAPRFQPLAPSGEQACAGAANLFDDLPQPLPKEVFQTLVQADHVRIERIVSHGHASPEAFWCDQPQHEWVIVLKGAARLQFENGAIAMQPGDYVHIPAFRKHRVAWTAPDEPTVWLAVHYGGT